MRFIEEEDLKRLFGTDNNDSLDYEGAKYCIDKKIWSKSVQKSISIIEDENGVVEYIMHGNYVFDGCTIGLNPGKITKGCLGLSIRNYGENNLIDGFSIVKYVNKETDTVCTLTFTPDGSYCTDYFIERRCFIPVIPDNDFIRKLCTTFSRCIEVNNQREIEKGIKTIKETHPEFINLIEIPICDACGAKLIGKRTYTYKGKKYCSSCWENLFIRCSRCGESFLKEDALITQDRHFLCNECAKYHFITSYHSLYPIVKFFGNGENSPFIGIELEVDCGGNNDKFAKLVAETMNNPGEVFVYCSNDSSLQKGFEIISQPATLEYHCSVKNKYIKLFNSLKQNGFLSHDTSTCGLHVHFNRDFFGVDRYEQEKCIERLIYIFEKFWKEIVVFSRRNKYKIDSYAKKISSPTTEYIKQYNKRKDHHGHYYAVNITNDNTIEIRIFRGTLNINTFIATLQFVNSCILTAKNKTEAEIRNMVFEDLCSDRTCKKYWSVIGKRVDTEE